MDFASPFVYWNENDADEEVDDEDVEQDLLSNLEKQLQPQAEPQFRMAGLAALPPPRPGAPAMAAAAARRPQCRRPKSPQSKRVVFRRRVDTNILRLDLGRLEKEVAQATGDVVRCEGCKACLSVHSKINPVIVEGPGGAGGAGSAGGAGGAGAGAGASPSGQYNWCCEFCGTDQVVDLDAEEIPKDAELDYLVSPAPVMDDADSLSKDAAAAAAQQQDSVVVFCVDISGSMCVTSEVEGKLKLKGDRTAEMNVLRGIGDDVQGNQGDQFIPGQNRNVTYVSRMQAMQAAVNSQLEEMSKTRPNTRVALVTFNGEVTLHGDCSASPAVIAGDRLESYEHLVQKGLDCELGQSIAESREALSDKLFDLQETGPTALGPAVVASVALASRANASKVILVTDGLANVGLGALDALGEGEGPVDDVAAGVNADAVVVEDAEAAAAERAANDFYQRVGLFAKQKGVTVDVIGIDGVGCDVEHLSILAETTSGDIEKVDPLLLAKNFGSILASPVVATQAVAKLYLHRGLRFRKDLDEEEDSEEGPGVPEGGQLPMYGPNGFVKVHDVGNVTADSEVTFEYDVRAPAELKALDGRIAATSAKAAAKNKYQRCPAAKPGKKAAAEEPAALPFQLQVEFTRLDGSRYIRVTSRSQPVTKERAKAEGKNLNMDIMSRHASKQCARMAKQGDYTESRANARVWGKLMQSNCDTEFQKESYGTWLDDMNEQDEVVHGAEREEMQSARMSNLTLQACSGLENASKAKKVLRGARKAARSKNDGLSGFLYKRSTKGTPRSAPAASKGGAAAAPAGVAPIPKEPQKAAAASGGGGGFFSELFGGRKKSVHLPQ